MSILIYENFCAVRTFLDGPCRFLCVFVSVEYSQYPLKSVDKVFGGYQTQNCEERSCALLFLSAEVGNG